MKDIQGWLQKEYIHLIKLISEVQEQKKIIGSVLEIGVYHGKFFIPMHNTLKENEASFAVDLFDTQELNIDRSGGGNTLEAFTGNLNKFGISPDKCTIIQADQLTWNPSQIPEFSCRMISIDGGHTDIHTYNALVLCEKLISNGGIIFVDDYQSMAWPGVHIGTTKFYLLHVPTVVPILLAWNKLVLCHISRYQMWLSFIKNNILLFTDKYKKVSMWGYSVIMV